MNKTSQFTLALALSSLSTTVYAAPTPVLDTPAGVPSHCQEWADAPQQLQAPSGCVQALNIRYTVDSKTLEKRTAANRVLYDHSEQVYMGESKIYDFELNGPFKFEIYTLEGGTIKLKSEHLRVRVMTPDGLIHSLPEIKWGTWVGGQKGIHRFEFIDYHGAYAAWKLTEKVDAMEHRLAVTATYSVTNPFTFPIRLGSTEVAPGETKALPRQTVRGAYSITPPSERPEDFSATLNRHALEDMVFTLAGEAERNFILAAAEKSERVREAALKAEEQKLTEARNVEEATKQKEALAQRRETNAGYQLRVDEHNRKARAHRILGFVGAAVTASSAGALYLVSNQQDFSEKALVQAGLVLSTAGGLAMTIIPIPVAIHHRRQSKYLQGLQVKDVAISPTWRGVSISGRF